MTKVKQSPAYPIEDERILTKAPKVPVIQGDHKPALFLDMRTGAYTDINGNPVKVRPRKTPPTEKFRPLEDLAEYDLGDAKVAWAGILSLIAVFALGTMAAGGILLAVYNSIFHP